MAISANTLFHFTKKNRLKEILQNNFSPKYSLEDLSNATPKISIYKKVYIPMVCFCDLLFSQIKDHIDFYGDYGIGLNKRKWGIKKGISPIVYVPANSISASHIQSIAIEIGSKLKNANDRRAIRKQLQNFYKYIKPFEGNVKNRKRQKLIHRVFYDEREWRYVPKNFPVVSKKRAKINLLYRANKKLEREEKLAFQARDIKYIIVKTETEIPQFVRFIETDLKDKFSDYERKLLVSKLISVEQINEDM